MNIEYRYKTFKNGHDAVQFLKINNISKSNIITFRTVLEYIEWLGEIKPHTFFELAYIYETEVSK